MVKMGRPAKYGSATEWHSVRLPARSYDFLEDLATKAGDSVPATLVAFIEYMRGQGEPGLRAISLQMELERERRTLVTVARQFESVVNDKNVLVKENKKLRAKLAGTMRLLQLACTPEQLARMPIAKLQRAIDHPPAINGKPMAELELAADLALGDSS